MHSAVNGFPSAEVRGAKDAAIASAGLIRSCATWRPRADPRNSLRTRRNVKLAVRLAGSAWLILWLKCRNHSIGRQVCSLRGGTCAIWRGILRPEDRKRPERVIKGIGNEEWTTRFFFDRKSVNVLARVANRVHPGMHTPFGCRLRWVHPKGGKRFRKFSDEIESGVIFHHEIPFNEDYKNRFRASRVRAAAGTSNRFFDLCTGINTADDVSKPVETCRSGSDAVNVTRIRPSIYSQTKPFRNRDLN